MSHNEKANNNVNNVDICKELNGKINEAETTILKPLKANINDISSYINAMRNAYAEVKSKFFASKEPQEIEEIEEIEVNDKIEVNDEIKNNDTSEEAIQAELVNNSENTAEDDTKTETVEVKSPVSEVVNSEKQNITTNEKPKIVVTNFNRTENNQYQKKPYVNTNNNQRNNYNNPRNNQNTNSGTNNRNTTPVDMKTAPLPIDEKNRAAKKLMKPTVDKKKFEDKSKLSKKTMFKKGYISVNYGYEYDDSGEIMKIRSRKASNKKGPQQKTVIKVTDHAVINTPIIPIKVLSEKIGKSCPQIIKKLFELSIIKTINDSIGFDDAELISSEFGISLELQLEQTNEEKLSEEHIENKEDDVNLVSRPPIVTIMGHVDHGKTSILDYIRKSNITSGEAGGITQHIGAYTVMSEGNQITFIDTPGHEAFTEMRARGADVTDIVVIVVAADDGIMPQTIEAIHHAKAAKNVDIIVAINKMDKPGANKDRVVQQLSENDILVEEWGGDVPAIPVSAKTGEGIDKLLQNIILVAELKELRANPNRNAKGVIIEAKLDKGKGPVATVLVQNGTLHNGDIIVAGTAMGKVRAMFDDKGKLVSEALPSTPVSILGLQDVPNAGDSILTVQDDKLARQVIDDRKNFEKEKGVKSQKVSLEDLFSKIEEGKFKELNLIIKADVQGTEEAVKQSMAKLSNEEVKVHIVHSGVGAINESDVSLADSTNAIIVGFNIRPDSKTKILAEQKNIEVKLYRVIYDAINDITAAIKGLLAPVFETKELGEAEVRQIFKVSSIGTIAGCMVTTGLITKNAQIRLVRDNIVITESTLASLRRIKDDVKEVRSGFDCGISLVKYNDIKLGDIIQAYIVEEKK
ncbi:MAG: translation initiation factor IF-2 [Clostridia bacterium]